MRAQPWRMPRPQVTTNPPATREHLTSMCLELAGFSHEDCPGAPCPCACGLGGHAPGEAA